MNADLLDAVRANLLSPAVLFFVLGVAATLLKSDLKIPEALYTTLTIYLLVSIGFKGGVAVSEAGLGAVWFPALAAIALGTFIPLLSYPILRFAGKLSAIDSAAICAHYGSVSAVTYIAATNFLKEVEQPFENYSAAFLAVMESPAIIVGLLLGKMGMRTETNTAEHRWDTALHEAVFGRSVLLLIGALFIGYLSGPRGMQATAGFFVTPFQGVLALFLLEMGMVASRRFADLRRVGLFLLAFGIIMPLVHGFVGVLLGKAVGLSLGGSMLMGVLAASASYIAAPAAVRLSLPEANPTLYLTSSLAITFPFNIVFGLPIYYAIAKWSFGAN